MRITTVLAGALAALALSAAPAAAQGRWLVSYPEAQDPMFAAMQQMFASQDMLSSMVDPLNEYFPVSRDVTVELAECGRAGAFYDAERPAVQLCYELVVELAEALMGDGAEEGGDDVFVGAFALILLHQVGHAMVDLLELPVRVGPEEAADQLAAVMVGFAEDELATAAEGALALNEMLVDWENPGSGRAALSGRRLETLLCLLYGTNPDAHGWLLEEGNLSEERAARCEEEYEKVEANWIDMLSQHVAG
ncbi:MAG TPA: DUF4344 domain-containing metallopeptidase [Longimicrobium sp.]|nr:DUF4344 domain-containing metallopeptidase [Longimicrobium sp.]